ncbi:MAG: hypothetical protein WCN98_09250, partial [Verrucomicrobiaceae bacterium]
MRSPSSGILALLILACPLPPLLFGDQPASLTELPDSSTDAEKAGFVIPEGFENNLWASEPMLHKPVQMNWDAQGRLWVVCNQTY